MTPRPESRKSTDRPFFIGWRGVEDPTSLGWLRRLASGLLILAALLALLLAAGQRSIGTGTFEFGNVRTFEGLFLESPTPILLTDEPVEGQTLFYLVAERKFGLDPELVRQHHLRRVRLAGTLIRNRQEGMIEVVTGSLEALSDQPLPDPRLDGRQIEPVLLQGEIVDGKCQLGVMNPGRRQTHRACALHCIRGGIPPLLRVEAEGEPAVYVLLMGEQGQPINRALLPYVALPVEVSGNLRRFGPRHVLYLDLGSLRLLD